jgi:branched-chain amino acid aminotransferase
MKAYPDANGDLRMFRPMENMKRMNKSMDYLGLPTFEGREFIDCIKALVRVEKDWMPKKPNHSLYIRPAGISTEVGK